MNNNVVTLGCALPVTQEVASSSLVRTAQSASH